ncbi:MAG TPA: hypothetical protein VK427_12030, partial [Kofleriaceae bacterium]|nr:hypothetical protein [Kofleriaceae bacterium]
GSLEVVNMDAGGDLDTASGKIVVKNVAGEVVTNSVSGATSLSQVFGSVDAQIMSSNLDLDSIGGERLVASVNHGKIEGRRVRSRNVELSTLDGKIILEGESSLRGRFVVSSVSGDIDIKLRKNGLTIIRARGAKVNLGATTKTQTRQDGWVEAQLIGMGTAPALIEMQSRRGVVKFAIIE